MSMISCKFSFNEQFFLVLLHRLLDLKNCNMDVMFNLEYKLIFRLLTPRLIFGKCRYNNLLIFY